MITAEDFSAWRDHPVTQAVLEALRNKADEAKQAWVASSWHNGDTRQELLADLRATSQTCDYVVTLDFGELEAMLERD